MHHRRPTARHRSLAALLLTVSVGATLSSCGFDYPTDRVNQIAAGANNREGDVDLLGIRVLATADGQGRLIGAIDNNTDEPVTLTGVTSPDGDATAEVQPVKLDADKAVNLATAANLPVTGDFAAGQIISLEFTFDNGDKLDLPSVPVVKNCYQYTSVPTPSEDSSSSATSESESTEGTESQSTESQGTESESESQSTESESAESGETSSGAGSAYACSDQETPPSADEAE